MDEILKKLSEYSVPELCDGAVDFKTMNYLIKPMINNKKIIGRAVTVKVPIGESAIVTEAIDIVKEDEIIVVAGGGGTKASYWGDHRSLCAKLKGAVGVVIDGAFRDIDECKEIGFPIFAIGVTPGAAGKSGLGAVNAQVDCGGVVVNPGDIIVGDNNGVIVIDPNDVDKIVLGAQKKIDAQMRIVEEMKKTGKVIPRIKVEK